VVDVGGGRGATLAAILRANPSVRGILFDLPQVIGEGLLPEVADVAGRCQVIRGNLLGAVPSGGDCYVLKRVLMDNSDQAAVGVLRKCADAMAEDGRVLVIEMVILGGEASALNALFDLNMLVLTGGRVRTDAEFRELFAGAGLRLTRTIPTDSPNWIIEGIRV
jgi:O-methyltransferase domain